MCAETASILGDIIIMMAGYYQCVTISVNVSSAVYDKLLILCISHYLVLAIIYYNTEHLATIRCCGVHDSRCQATRQCGCGVLRFAQDPSLPTTPSDTDTRGVHPTERAQRSCAEGRV